MLVIYCLASACSKCAMTRLKQHSLVLPYSVLTLTLFKFNIFCLVAYMPGACPKSMGRITTSASAVLSSFLWNSSKILSSCSGCMQIVKEFFSIQSLAQNRHLRWWLHSTGNTLILSFLSILSTFFLCGVSESLAVCIKDFAYGSKVCSWCLVEVLELCSITNATIFLLSILSMLSFYNRNVLTFYFPRITTCPKAIPNWGRPPIGAILYI